MKYFMPTKGIGLKKRLPKEFPIVNVDEYNTSKKCYNCGSDIIKFMRRENPRPYKKNEILGNGLLHCKNGLCDKYFDRDLNGSLNIRKIALNSINSIARPKYLQRKRRKIHTSFDDEAINITKQKVKIKKKIYNKSLLYYQKCVQKLKETL
jgi:hypothetical protein